MSKRTIVIGFMLFALFFGAGNLIFPPKLGWNSGDTFNWAILGFIITGVGLPLIGVIAGSFTGGGFNNEAKRIHPVFAVLFMVTIYLTIGPFFAIPRTATVSYEMGIVPFIGGSHIKLFIFSLIYFIVVYALSISPSKIVTRIGQILTPLLLIAIAALVIRAFFVLGDPVTAIAPEFNADTPFFNGFLEGYNTMDTIAAVVFSIIVLNAVKATGLSTQKDIFKDAFTAVIVAGTCLALVYLSLGWMGNHYAISADQLAQVATNKQDLGTYILTGAANLAYGISGKLLISIIVGLACLTTSIGLVVAVSSYFYELWPRHSYRTYVIIFTLVSFGLANQGLSQVIKGSLPVLLIIYPITMVLIALVFINKIFKGIPDLCYQLPIYPTIIISILSVTLPKTVAFLPYGDISMQWLLPAVAALLLAGLISKVTVKSGKDVQKHNI